MKITPENPPKKPETKPQKTKNQIKNPKPQKKPRKTPEKTPQHHHYHVTPWSSPEQLFFFSHPESDQRGRADLIKEGPPRPLVDRHQSQRHRQYPPPHGQQPSTRTRPRGLVPILIRIRIRIRIRVDVRVRVGGKRGLGGCVRL